LSISDPTAKRYLDILTGTFLIRQVQPWFYNTQKRLVKRPKIYFRDSGLLHTLLSLKDRDDVLGHPQLGASWEGFALEQVVQHLGLREQDVFFWAVHTGAELDLVFQHKGKLWGIEAKYGDVPTLTKSMHAALEELSLAHLWVVYPGLKPYDLNKQASIVPIQQLGLIKL